jgi:hypothetical protein
MTRTRQRQRPHPRMRPPNLNMNYAMRGMMDMSTMAVGASLMGGMIGVASNAIPKPP